MPHETSWSVPILLSDIQRGVGPVELSPDAPTRKRIADLLGLVDLVSFSAQAKLTPWFDGARLDGDWRATVVQTCGVTLDPFETALAGAFQINVVPPGSPMIVEAEDEVEVDLDAPDPPDVLDRDAVDVAHYVVEQLALEIDPYPRKPGVAFDPPPAETPPSPFAALAALRPDPRGSDRKT